MTISRASRWPWIGVILLHFFHFLPYFISEDPYIRIHDTLEGELGWLHLQSIQPEPFSPAAGQEIAQTMNGLPRDAVPGPFSIVQVFINVFGTFTGYMIHRGLVHVVAFWSMYWLLGVLGYRNVWRIWGALVYSFVPFFSVFGIAIAGLPAIWAAGQSLLQQPKHPGAWLVLLIFPFWASAIWGAPASVLILSFLGLDYLRKQRKIPWPAVGGMVLHVAGFAMALFPMLRLLCCHPDFISHRTAYIPDEPDFSSATGEFLQLLFIGHYHTGILMTLPVIVMALLSLGREKPYRWIFPAIFAICFFQAGYPLAAPFFETYLPFVDAIRPNRLHTLLPMLWVVLFVRSLTAIDLHQLGRWIPTMGVVAQLSIGFFAHDEILHNYRNLTGFSKFPGHQAFVAKPLFDAFKRHVGTPPDQFRVICLGFPPAVAWYNGLYTLDGLHAIYDLRYKNRFYRLMARELNRDPKLKKYFLNWGNRCFIFSAEMGFRPDAFIPTLHRGKKIQKLLVSNEAFEEMGGTYLLSALPIESSAFNHFTLKETITSPEIPWNLYIYTSFSRPE